MSKTAESGTNNSTKSSLPEWAHFDSQTQTLYLLVHAKPGKRKSEIEGLHNGRIKISLKAVPEDGKANCELIRLLSDYLSYPQSLISLDLGTSSPMKRLAFHDVSNPLFLIEKILYKVIA